MISSNQQPNSGEQLVYSGGIAMDATPGRALIVDPMSKRLLAVDLATGVRSIVSDNSTPDGAEPFSSPYDVAVDRAGKRALVLDTGRSAVIAVDLATGRRSVLSDATTPDATNPLYSPFQFTLDRVRNRLLVVDLLPPDSSGVARPAIVGVNISTGRRQILTTFDDVSAQLQGIAVDEFGDRVLVSDLGESAVVVVDPITGAQKPFSGASQQNPSVGFSPGDVAVDPASGRIVVLDLYRELLAVNPLDGERVVLSR